MSKPRLLDLFCGAGGCAAGYAQAGFEVVGVDIAPQPHYPYEFHQADALEVLDILLSGDIWQGYRLSDFAAIHASPPCQLFSVTNHVHKKAWPDLLNPIRKRLSQSGVWYVIENVQTAPLPGSVLFCGTMFGLKIFRHRLFEANFLILLPGQCSHRGHRVKFFGKKGKKTHDFITVTGHDFVVAEAQEAMGIPWMNRHELAQAIPPAYTAWIGAQLMTALEQEASA